MLINDKDKLAQSLSAVKPLPTPSRVLMVDPAYYSVDYVINPHMKGHIGTVNKETARNQWVQLKKLFVSTGLSVTSMPGIKGLPDMVFCANQSLPYIDESGKKHVALSTMFSDQRKEEVSCFEQWYQQNDYVVHYPKATAFEGMGDAIWHYKKRLLWGGYGFRTDPAVYGQLNSLFKTPVAMLELVHPSFYHLDTCFCILDERTVLIYPNAFSDNSLDLIHAGFERVIATTEDEAGKLFACNACCPDGNHVIIQKGCKKTIEALHAHGFEVLETETSEYLKSGGSVFCMKLLLW